MMGCGRMEIIMTQEERYKITSNEYLDYYVDYNGNEAVLDRHRENSVQVLDQRLAIAYLPANQITDSKIREIGFMAIPSVFGLVSEQSLEASGITQIRRLPNLNLRGEGVLVGIVDTGIDYTNPVFQKADGTTRIVSIWDQTIDSEDQFPEGTFYGTEYMREQINEALKSQNPFEVVPSRDENGHGTMLAGIAAGNEMPDDNFSGVVPDAEMIVVKMKPAKQIVKDFFAIPESALGYQLNDIMWGVEYLIKVARRLRRPISICIGLGTTLGPHDGRGFISNQASRISDYPGIVMCIAAGNEGNTRGHFFGTIDTTIGSTTVELNVGENETGFSMQLWGASPDTYSIDILAPSGEYIPRISEGLNVSENISFVFERTVIKVIYQMIEVTTGEQMIFLRFTDPSPGIWKFQVYARGDLPGSFHIWLPMREFVSENTYFIQSNPYTTVTGPGNAMIPITVTAYNSVDGTLYRGAGRGFTVNNLIKPELAAPGVNITAPTLSHGFEDFTGTSAATAHATGITAMILEWAIVRDNYPGVDAAEVKKFLIRGAIRSRTLEYPNRDWGYGIINIFNTFDIIRSTFTGR